ncbi:MFS transporter [Salinicola rhizosphaerae]|uniref:Alpha-ketoglutarate permease n=1 Tax=Salinicola rhizosphaerae TaxID=1443141 RepID=A0ABQ3E2A1_9GAMM|nr:MFS transporter [Salinicola rhizosphaerae]GHB18667.1 alpha-ketoglutarate permease [Salinicola rhizosphaerae]
MNHFLTRIGMPPSLALGYLGVVIFMMGDGLEAAWLQSYLVGHGLTETEAATVFAGYGVTVAIGSWFSGVLTEAFGPTKTMLSGALLFVFGTVLFIPAISSGIDYTTLLWTYPMRGFAYPMFSYSFLLVIAQVTPKARLGSAVGWFWFCFTFGFFVLGAQYSDLGFSLLQLTPIDMLWTGLIFIAIGTAIALFSFFYNRRRGIEIAPGKGFKAKSLLKGITIAVENYKIGFGGLARTINTVASYGFIAFMPSIMQNEVGYTQSEWLQIWAMLFFSNIIANLIAGAVGDRIGWRQTIMWGGGFLCMLSVLGFYYLPVWTGSYWLGMLMAICLGFGLGGFVPLSALMPSLAPENKGAALSVLNLGAGLSTFVGTALVSVLLGSLGPEGIIWIFAVLYGLSIALVRTMTLDDETAPSPAEHAVPTSPSRG